MMMRRDGDDVERMRGLVVVVYEDQRLLLLL